MKIAILSQNQQYCSTRRHVDVATERRGHDVALFDVFSCYMNVTANSPQAHYNSKELPALDAVIKNDVWAWDLVHDSYGNGKKFRCLTVKDEATGNCLAIEVDTSIKNIDVQQLLKLLITRHGRPKAIRSVNEAEFIANDLQRCMKKEGISIATIDPGKPWQSGSNESLNGTFRNECLDAELFGSLTEAKVVIADWRRRYNQLRPHSTYGYITPEMAYFPKHANREKLTA